MQDQIIHNKSWMTLGDCNYEIDHDDDSIPESGVVYCNIEHIHKFFAKCRKTTNRYIVVSGFSDYGLAIQKEHPVSIDMRKALPFIEQAITPEMGYGNLDVPPRCELERCNIEDEYSIKCYAFTYSTLPEIPDNVVKWFLVNTMTRDRRVTSIPLGVGKDAPKDVCSTVSNQIWNFDRGILTDKISKVKSGSSNWVYLNWQDNTIERANLKSGFINANPEWVNIVRQPKPYLDYLEDLKNHVFTLCPEGNGVDCYRIMECLYCGSIPIVSNQPAYDYLHGLPHVRVNSWNEVHPKLLQENLEIIMKSSYDMDKIKLDYWKNLIESSRNLL